MVVGLPSNYPSLKKVSLIHKQYGEAKPGSLFVFFCSYPFFSFPKKKNEELIVLKNASSNDNTNENSSETFKLILPSTQTE